MEKPDSLSRCTNVDGCYWHGCPKCYVRPKQNQTFWDAKFQSNKLRDRKVNRGLKAVGWQVLRLWEHELVKKRETRLTAKLKKRLGDQG
jgi:DNA mismatch endonuclease, patch repair protein